MPLANQLGAHVDLGKLAAQIKKSPLPIAGIGLGAQGAISGVAGDAIPEGSWEWLNTIASKAVGSHPNITLRGPETLRVIAEKGLGDACVITGCPSNFTNPNQTLGRQINRRRSTSFRKIAVAAGNPFLPQFAKLEQSLIRLTQSDGLYVVQHPIDLLRLSMGEHWSVTPGRFEHHRRYLSPDRDDRALLDYMKSRAATFVSVADWMNTLKHYDLVVGTRIHGIMAAIQAGVPGICLYIDSRTRELCETMKIPCADANDFKQGFSVEQAEQLFHDWDWRSYDDRRRELANVMCNFLKNNRIKPQGPILEILAYQRPKPVKEKNGFLSTHQESISSFPGRNAKIFSAIKEHLADEQPSKILSFGCSDGFEVEDLANTFSSAQIVGCDIDQDAVRIATLGNQHFPRVRIKHTQDIGKQNFDLILAITVLCKSPATAKAEDCSKIYPHEDFRNAIAELSDRLVPGGHLVVFNANYRVEDIPDYQEKFTPVKLDTLPSSQQVRIFDADGKRSANQSVRFIVHRKK